MACAARAFPLSLLEVGVVLQLMAPLPRLPRWWPITSVKWVACEELRIVSPFGFLS